MNDQLQAFISDFNLPDIPHESEEFIGLLREFISELPEVDTSLQVAARRELGIPEWSAHEQVERLVSVVREVCNQLELDPVVLAPALNACTSYYSPLDMVKIFPREDVVINRDGKSVLKEEIHLYGNDIKFPYDLRAWELLHNTVARYYAAVQKLSVDVRQRIVDIPYSLVRPHKAATMLIVSSEFPGVVLKQDDESGQAEDLFAPSRIFGVKMHYPELSLYEDCPIEFALDEYRMRIHELTHVLQLGYVEEPSDVHVEFEAEAITAFTLEINDIPFPEPCMIAKTTAPEYKKGREAGRAAAKSKNPIKTLRRLLWR